MPSVEELEAALAELKAQKQHVVANSVPQQQTEDRYAVTTWAETEFDFKTPSGQLCRLKKVDIAELAEAGILDQVTRLPGVAAETVREAEGAPPVKAEELPSRETIRLTVDVVNVLLPLVVVAPRIWPIPEDGKRLPDRIYVDSVEIVDRIAIMNRVLGDLQKLDNFRPQS